MKNRHELICIRQARDIVPLRVRERNKSVNLLAGQGGSWHPYLTSKQEKKFVNLSAGQVRGIRFSGVRKKTNS